MCVVCSATMTFDPTRHLEDSDNPLSASVFEGVDAAENTSTAYSMSVGDSFFGTLSSTFDEDWVSIQLTAGETYRIDLSGTGTSGDLSDPYLTLFNSSGTYLIHDDDSGGFLDSSLTFTASYTGTYYIEADAYSTQTGDYVIDVSVEAPPTPPSEATLDELALYLTEGYWGNIERTFDTTSSNVITVNLSGLTAAGQQLARWAMEAWEMVVDLDFQEVSSGEMITFDDEESGAFAYAPNSGSTSTGVELNVGTGWLSSYGTSIDSYSFQTYVHEIGHAIGLGHQGGYNGSASYPNDATFANDSWLMSVMSYFSQTENTTVTSGYAFVAGPMMSDILAIQNLYGTPGASSATAGNTTYGLNSNLGNYMDQVFNWLATGTTTANVTGNEMVFTIYDVGGTDTIDLSFTNENVRLDLREEMFSDVGAITNVLAISRGTVIENVILGGGNDTVTGNAGNNRFDLGSGNDSALGGLGMDVLIGGIGFDTLRGGQHDDTLLGGNGADSLYGDNGNDRLEGGSGFDQLFGGNSNDTLFGGATADRLYGGENDDFLSGGSNFGITVDGLWGEAGNDTIYGDGGFDLLDGGTGDDYMDGGNQADNLFGRDGDDTLYGGQGLDRLFGGNDDDLAYGGTENDGLFGDSGNDTLLGEAGDDRFFGGSGNDLILGGADNDTINGGSGFDTINGGQGDDLMFGRFNADRFVFVNGHGNDTIGDFNALNNFERIDFSGLSTINSLADLNLGSATAGAATQVGGNVLITTGGSSSILLTGVSLGDLDGFDFVF